MRDFQCHGVGPVRFECSAQRLAVLFLVAVVLLAFSGVALAADPSPVDAFSKSTLGSALENLVSTLNGTIARSLAIIAVIGMGIAALTGRVEWSRAIVVVLGVGIIFSAATLIDGLFGTGPATKTTETSSSLVRFA